MVDSSEKLTFGHSNGVVQSHDEFADVVDTGQQVFKLVDFSKLKLTVSGNVAVERHHFSADIIYEGALRTFELEIVEVWKMTDKCGCWRGKRSRFDSASHSLGERSR